MKRINMKKHTRHTGRELECIPLRDAGFSGLMRDLFETVDPFAGCSLLTSFRTPAMDIYEKDDKVIVKADIPGMKKDDIKLHLEKGVLTIAGETKREREEKRENFYCAERSRGRIQRSISLPEGVKKEGIKASYKDGVMTIEIPKLKEAKEKGKDIAID